MCLGSKSRLKKKKSKSYSLMDKTLKRNYTIITKLERNTSKISYMYTSEIEVTLKWVSYIIFLRVFPITGIHHNRNKLLDKHEILISKLIGNKRND